MEHILETVTDLLDDYHTTDTGKDCCGGYCEYCDAIREARIQLVAAAAEAKKDRG